MAIEAFSSDIPMKESYYINMLQPPKANAPIPHQPTNQPTNQMTICALVPNSLTPASPISRVPGLSPAMAQLKSFQHHQKIWGVVGAG
jgi:hypothetical protein